MMRIEVPCEAASRRARIDVSEAAGHEFRSKLLNKTAVIEMWAVGVLRRTSKSGDSAAPKKLPHLFGKRLDAVRKIAEVNSSPLKRPSAVSELLDRIRPYADLRSALAHSVLRGAIDEKDEPIFIFTHASQTSDTGLPLRMVFTNDEMNKLLRELAPLANELTQQQCKA